MIKYDCILGKLERIPTERTEIIRCPIYKKDDKIKVNGSVSYKILTVHMKRKATGKLEI